MKWYYAESIQHINGIDRIIGHSFEAMSSSEAEAICAKNKWEYVGEAQYEQEADDELVAIVELQLAKPTRH